MRVRREVLSAIAAHAQRDSPRECCGLLLGTSGEIVEAVAASNVADDPVREYEVSPADHFALIRRCRAPAGEGEVPVGVVGGYHSHPRSAPDPSPTDRERAFEDFLYVIAGRVGTAGEFEIRAYRFTDGRFAAVPLHVVAPPGGATPPAPGR